MKSYNVTIQIKATEQFFAVGVFIMMFKKILTSESELNPKVWAFKWSFWALFSCCSVYFALLYRHECFTGKYTAREIHKNYIRDSSVYFP